MGSRNSIKLFGTDGIRSKVGEFPLDYDSLSKFGNILGELWKGLKIITGRDTRESGEEVERLIVSGFEEKSEIFSCNVISTPGFSYILDHSDFDYGIMITASHNPYIDNGIKIFKGNGEKISGDFENRIEEVFFSLDQISQGNIYDRKKKHINQLPYNFLDMYKKFLVNNALELKKSKFMCVLDCANGATSVIAPEVFEKLNLDTIVINAEPDGKNINQKCGSTNLESLKNTVISKNADIGIAFDGDGDRVIFVDNRGFVLDGDHALFLFSDYLLNKNNNFNKVVVGTIMSNLGIEKALNKQDVEFIRTRVGDRFVYEEMKKRDSILGGEQSGHIILRNYQKTGDGIMTALFFLKSLFFFKMKADDVRKKISLFPQEIKNIQIREKRNLSKWDELNTLIKDFNDRYGENSRVIIRYSGTEAKIRIMMESEFRTIIDENLEKFVNLIGSNIGV